MPLSPAFTPTGYNAKTLRQLLRDIANADPLSARAIASELERAFRFPLTVNVEPFGQRTELFDLIRLGSVIAVSFSVAANVGNVGNMQLWNNGNGNRFFVLSAKAMSAGATGVIAGTDGAQMALGAGGGTFTNLLAGDAAALSQRNDGIALPQTGGGSLQSGMVVRSNNAIGGPQGRQAFISTPGANSFAELLPAGMMVELPANTGFDVSGQDNNALVTMQLVVAVVPDGLAYA